MYKTKLQELCQKRQWGLPKYSVMKDGPDHTPSFKSSVIVNGLSFHSPFPSNSSKESQNSAAKAAFLRFTSPPPNSSISRQPDLQETCDAPHSHTISHDFPVKEDVQYQYKSQLQNYAQCNNLDLPFYSSAMQGPSDDLRFKATVTVDGHASQSPKFSTTSKEAENAAAKSTLESMMADDCQEENSGVYKNSLKELAKREGLSTPVYKTINTGAAHMPTFFSFVEIEGEKFYGKAGKTKKAAEIKAAKAAYTFLMEDLTTAVDLQQDVKHNDEILSSPVIGQEEQSEKSKVQDASLAETLQANLKIGSQDPILSHSSLLNTQKMTGSSFSEPANTLFKEGSVSSDIAKNGSNLPLLSSSTNTGNPGVLPGGYLLCEKVKVYSSYPKIVFPKGITVLQISDNKWVPVSLEFPNEQGR